jgi:hypothetical protein
MQSTTMMTSRMWLPVLTIGTWLMSSGRGGTPTTTASMSAPRTATPTRSGERRASSATAASSSGNAPT